MHYVVLFFGVLVVLGGAAVLIKPTWIFGIFSKYGDSSGLHLFAVIVRLILGIALVMSAAFSRYPLVLEILGWLTIATAIVLSVMGRERFKKLIAWAHGIKPERQRAMGLVGIVFGAFLIYAVY